MSKQESNSDSDKRITHAFRIALERFLSNQQFEELKMKNQRVVDFLATHDGREALRRIVSDTKNAEAEKMRRIAESEEETARMEVPFGAELNNEAVFQVLYDSYKRTLMHFGFLRAEGAVKEGDAPLPDMDSVMKSFTGEDIRTAKTFIKPSLVLMPETSFAYKLEAVNSKKGTYSNSLKASVTPDLADNKQSSEKVSAWRAYIVENDIDNKKSCRDDNPCASCADRAKNQASLISQNYKPADRGLDRHLHIMLVMDYLKKNLSPSLIGKKVLLWGEFEPANPNIITAFCISGNLIYRSIPSYKVCSDACLGPRFVGGNVAM